MGHAVKQRRIGHIVAAELPGGDVELRDTINHTLVVVTRGDRADLAAFLLEPPAPYSARPKPNGHDP